MVGPRIVAGCATDVVDRQWDQVMRSNAPAIVYEWTDQPLRKLRVVELDGYQDHLKTVIWLLSLAGATDRIHHFNVSQLECVKRPILTAQITTTPAKPLVHRLEACHATS